MAPRAYWKGSLKLSLVSCPVLLYPASTSVEKTRFHMINKETGNRLKQQMVDAETGDVVESDQKGRGYELKKGEYVEIEKEELEAVQIESNHTIEIDSFVPQRRDRQALSQPSLLHRARRQGRHRRLRRDPRRHEGPGPRRAGAHRADQPRACHRDRAARQGPARHHAALSLRTARRGRLFRRHQEPEDLEGHGRTRRATSSTPRPRISIPRNSRTSTRTR